MLDWGARSLIEVGCNEGQNLFLLARTAPDVHLAGVDVNRGALTRAGARFAALGRKVDLREASMEDLSAFPRNAFDVALSDAVLMYASPPVIRRALAEMLRVAPRVLISEWHDPDAGAAGRFHRGHWIYDYRTLLESLGAGDVVVRAFPRGAWADGDWTRFGHLIEASRAGGHD